MATVDRFLLTRYNVAYAAGGQLGTDAGWLSRRLELFVKYCVPSVRSQQPGWRWLIFVADTTPPAALGAIGAAVVDVPGVELVPSGPWTDDTPGDAVRSRVSADVVVTARLDNDDAIARDYLASVADLEPGHARVMSRGYQLHVDTGKIYTRHLRRGPFVAAADAGDARTVFAFPHTKVDQHFAATEADGDGWYLQVVHGENLDNPRRTGLLVDPAEVDRRIAVAELPTRPPLFAARRAETQAVQLAKRLKARLR